MPAAVTMCDQQRIAVCYVTLHLAGAPYRWVSVTPGWQSQEYGHACLRIRHATATSGLGFVLSVTSRCM